MMDSASKLVVTVCPDVERLKRMSVSGAWCELVSGIPKQSGFGDGQRIKLQCIDISARAPVLDPVCVCP